MSDEKQLVVTEKNIGEFIEKISGSLSEYNKRADSEWSKTAMLCIAENDALRECLGTSQGKASLYHALRYAARTALSLNPQEGKACLIPYKGEIQYQVMKNGLIEMAMQSGRVKSITADTVRENDTFELSRTNAGDEYRFSPARKSRGEIDGYFAAVSMVDGTTTVLYMTQDEIEDHKKKYGQGVDKSYSAWGKSGEGMAIKTVIKKLLRNLYISPEMSEAIGIDDQHEPIDVTPSKGSTPDDLAAAIKSEPVETEDEPPMKTVSDEKTGDLF